MPATFDTLEYVDANGMTQEVALPMTSMVFVGVGQLVPVVTVKMTPSSHAAGEFVITWAQPPEMGISIPFKSQCVVWASRISATGAQNSFSGGSPLFVGRRTDNSGRASASGISSSITLSDILWDLSKITFQQASNEITGGTLSAPTYTPFFWPDVVLFQALPGSTYLPESIEGTITSWQQIEDILNYVLLNFAGASAVKFQFSSAPGFTPVYRNWYPMRSVKCLEAIQKCLATHPGVYMEVDYTTTDGGGNPLPTIHFRDRTTMTPLTLPYKSQDANGILHVATDIKPLPELVPDNVRLYYSINSTFNGQPIKSPYIDAYPANANSLLNQDYSIDVTGSNQTETIKNFVSIAFDPTQLTLWRQKVASLHQINQGGQIPNDGSGGALKLLNAVAYDSVANPGGIQVLGDDGNDYSSDYGSMIPFLTDDSIYTWFQKASGAITVIKATVKAHFSYSKINTSGTNSTTDVIPDQQHTLRCVLCSLPTNQYVLKQTLNVGESIPAGLAQALWTELQPLQWKLNHEIWQVAANNASLPTIVKPGKHMINLNGGNAVWTAMNAVPERVQIELMRVFTGGTWVLAAKTAISCGPVDHLNPAQLIQLANVFRNRDRAKIDMTSRLNGNTSSTQVDLSTTAGEKENSVPGLNVFTTQNLAYTDVGGNFWSVKFSAVDFANNSNLN